MNILENIISYKRIEVDNQKKLKSIHSLELEPFFNKRPLSLKESLLDPTKTGIIAEFKRKSPSRGIINGSVNVKDVTNAYAKYGASGISVLTDHEFFGGSLNDLVAATASGVPLLRKEFMIDEYQVIE